MNIENVRPIEQVLKQVLKLREGAHHLLQDHVQLLFLTHAYVASNVYTALQPNLAKHISTARNRPGKIVWGTCYEGHVKQEKIYHFSSGCHTALQCHFLRQCEQDRQRPSLQEFELPLPSVEVVNAMWDCWGSIANTELSPMILWMSSGKIESLRL